MAHLGPTLLNWAQVGPLVNQAQVGPVRPTMGLHLPQTPHGQGSWIAREGRGERGKGWLGGRPRWPEGTSRSTASRPPWRPATVAVADGKEKQPTRLLGAETGRTKSMKARRREAYRRSTEVADLGRGRLGPMSSGGQNRSRNRGPGW